MMIAEDHHEWMTPPQIDKLLTQMMRPNSKYRTLIQTFYPPANIHFKELQRASSRFHSLAAEGEISPAKL